MMLSEKEIAMLPIQLGDVVVDDLGRIGRLTKQPDGPWVRRWSDPDVVVYHVQYHGQLPEMLRAAKEDAPAPHVKEGMASGHCLWGYGEWDSLGVINKAAAPQLAWWGEAVMPLIAREER